MDNHKEKQNFDEVEELKVITEFFKKGKEVKIFGNIFSYVKKYKKQFLKILALIIFTLLAVYIWTLFSGTSISEQIKNEIGEEKSNEYLEKIVKSGKDSMIIGRDLIYIYDNELFIKKGSDCECSRVIIDGVNTFAEKQSCENEYGYQEYNLKDLGDFIMVQYYFVPCLPTESSGEDIIISKKDGVELPSVSNLFLNVIEHQLKKKENKGSGASEFPSNEYKQMPRFVEVVESDGKYNYKFEIYDINNGSLYVVDEFETYLEYPGENGELNLYSPKSKFEKYGKLNKTILIPVKKNNPSGKDQVENLEFDLEKDKGVVGVESDKSKNKKEKRCGYLVNSTPGNWWIGDADGSWIISEQMGYRADGEIPDISEADGYEEMNISGGVACACVDGVFNHKNNKVVKINKWIW